MDAKLVILCFVSPKPVSASHELSKYGNLVSSDIYVAANYTNALICTPDQYDLIKEEISSGKFNTQDIKISGWKNYSDSGISKLDSFAFDQIFDLV